MQWVPTLPHTNTLHTLYHMALSALCALPTVLCYTPVPHGIPWPPNPSTAGFLNHSALPPLQVWKQEAEDGGGRRSLEIPMAAAAAGVVGGQHPDWKPRDHRFTPQGLHVACRPPVGQLCYKAFSQVCSASSGGLPKTGKWTMILSSLGQLEA